MKSMEGKVAFITGGGGGIGRGIAQACLDRGMKVALADISERLLDENARALRQAGDRLTTVVLDVREPASWDEAAKVVESRLGPVRMLFNNAGVSSAQAVVAGGGLANLTLEEWRWTLAVNLDGVFLGLKTFVPRFMATHESCHISNTASTAAPAILRSPRLPLSYAAAKAGVAHMTAQFRTELDMQGVKHIGTSVIYPGKTRTDILAISYELSPGREKVALDEIKAKIPPATGADPMLVGQYILLAIERGDFHIFTHAEWRERTVRYLDEIRHSFVASADPTFQDPAAETIDLTWADSWPDRRVQKGS